MQTKTSIKIKPKYLKEYQKGYPLLTHEMSDDWSKVSQEGTLIDLYDWQNNFVARGYYGRQNKGYGWVLSNNKRSKIDSEFFTHKIKDAIAYRKAFYQDSNTTAFRIFNGEGDGVGGVTIDYFDGYYLFTWYSLGIYHFHAQIIEALKNSVEYKGIYQKKRFDQKGQYLDEKDDFICGSKAAEPLIIKENGINFAIYLDDGPMVGIFLDQREVRNTIKNEYAQNKTLLNTFSYTGAFSIAAALGGATKTTSVDLAKRSLPKTQEHFNINNINPDVHDIIVEDVFNYFKYAVRKKFLFDIVVVDPPSFARSKKHTFSVAKDYVKLLKEVISITQKGGLIVASTNYANFDLKHFKGMIDKAFKALKTPYRIEETFTLPKDFRVNEKFVQGNYLKVIFVKKLY